MRQFHRILDQKSNQEVLYCQHHDCGLHDAGSFTEKGTLFNSATELQKHFRRVHNQVPFQCPVTGCDRTGSKGWFRSNDRAVHQRKVHFDLTDEVLQKMNKDADANKQAYFGQYK
jgi:hypothetical protein